MLTNNLYCIVGPSGCGKTTLMEDLKRLGFTEAISYTTRKCRGGSDISAYHFVSEEEFEKMIQDGIILEHVRYAGAYYGTSIPELDANDFVILEPVGVRAVKSRYHTRPVKVIGITADFEVLRSRLQSRTDGSDLRIEKDKETFKDLKTLADVCITSVVPKDTLKKTLEYLRCCGEKVIEGPIL